MANVEVSVARLNPEKIELYEQIHRAIPPDYAAALRLRCSRLDIHRSGDLLVMIVERHRVGSPAPGAVEQAQAEAWKATLAECFAEDWRPARMIFEL